MTKSLFFVFALSVIAGNISGQRLNITLAYQVTSPRVTYQTPGAIINFKKQDVLDEFDNLKTDYWYTSLEDERKKKYENVVKWLRNQNNVSLSESYSSNDNDLILVDLIKQAIGARLLLALKAEVQKNGGERQTAIEYETYTITPTGSSYGFFFPNENQSFFYGQGGRNEVKVDVNEDRSQSVFFEEPVEEKPVAAEDAVFTVVEQPPSYPGGIGKFYDYLNSNLKYPRQAKRKHIEGSVFIYFVVTKDGTLQDIKVIKGLESDCDKEALRLVRNGGAWIPGKQNGKIINAKFVVPVKFKLSNK